MCCQSPILAIMVKIPKIAKIVYRQMPAPQPRQKLGYKSPRVGQTFGANPRGCSGDGYGKNC